MERTVWNTGAVVERNHKSKINPKRLRSLLKCPIKNKGIDWLATALLITFQAESHRWSSATQMRVWIFSWLTWKEETV